MKYLYLLFIAVAFAGCTRNEIEITGTAYGVADGTILLKDASGQTLAGVNISNGRFHIGKTYLPYSYYGTLTLSQAGKSAQDFELYLEPGQYEIVFDKNNLNNYPQVTSGSAIQNQLSAYHALDEEIKDASEQKLRLLDGKYKRAIKSPQKWDDSTTSIANQAQIERTKALGIGQQVMMAYVNKYPKNEIAAHMMQGMDFEADPAGYYAVYQKLTSSQKNSDEGKAIGSKLKAIIRLVPGAPAPPIVGTTPDGKTVDLAALHKKVILVEFWKAANVASRRNHQVMVSNPFPAMMSNKLAIVSVSLDRKRDWWLGSMRDDKLTWTQVSDLKGIDSPNRNNWAIDDLPTYYLLDGKGRIIERNVSFNHISTSVGNYLDSH
ncbi:thioredoxin-like domain-containing protein [Mucilaginibacter sp. UR6-11]|uniref:thioredoxin-like domain-containing protein n=1 Tax=Mucilaginibacter sp. UR6-11 TaxID=1435644 RepID=UPI001E40430F|nr:thioredoxin-like domain-containing protein [Mucilaginibacter sp. UR6-11]MCC8424688.1 hypothetical protein [Mucilaginibacter sp. UR6-11]